jgi:aspartate kinase
VEFAKEKGIAIYARATASALPGGDPSADGTVVRKHPPRMPGTVVGVASEKEVLLVECDGHGLHLLETLDEHHVAGKQLQHAGARTTVVLSRENLHEENRLRTALAERFGSSCQISDALGAVSVVGAGINASFDNVRRGSRTLAAAGIAPAHLSTSSFRITWMLDRTRLNEAVRLLHAHFIEPAELVP